MKIIIIWGSVLCAIGAVISKWTESNLEFWLSLIKGQPVDVPYILALILTIFVNGVGILFNVVSELLKLVI
jgi:hypothetical protein